MYFDNVKNKWDKFNEQTSRLKGQKLPQRSLIRRGEKESEPNSKENKHFYILKEMQNILLERWVKERAKK